MTINWVQDPTFRNAIHAEHVVIDDQFELIAYELAGDPPVIGYEIFPGPAMATLVRRGNSATSRSSRPRMRTGRRARRSQARRAGGGDDAVYSSVFPSITAMICASDPVEGAMELTWWLATGLAIVLSAAAITLIIESYWH